MSRYRETTDGRYMAIRQSADPLARWALYEQPSPHFMVHDPHVGRHIGWITEEAISGSGWREAIV